ncbi:MAG: hypothetical protein KUG77_24320 [Nannocystaceae bacterium]|nr:hypothetical protein [Nannocystaceae bacterium]
MFTLHDTMGLPTFEDVQAAAARMRQHFERDDTDGPDDEHAWLWAVGIGAAGGYLVYRKLRDTHVEQSGDVEFELPRWEIDGIAWTVERTRIPGPQFAARVGEPLLHGGTAVPGPGSSDVAISGRPALTVDHVVGACPMPNVAGLPHLPQTGPTAWRTTNASVYVNAAPLLRAGDWVLESFGGPNPIIAGAPRVLAGPPAAPCVVQEVTFRPVSDFVPGLQRFGSLGGTVSLKGTVKWSAWDMIKGAGAAALLVSGGPVGGMVGRAVLGSVDGPTLEVEFEAKNKFFSDWLFDLDLDRDGTVDVLVDARLTCDASMNSKHSAVLDPRDPTKTKRKNNSGLESEIDCHRPQVQAHKPGQRRKPWKDEKKE